MTVREIKAQALEILQGGPWTPEPLDPRAPAVHLLKRDGLPIVTANVGRFGDVVLRHYLVETKLTADEIKARRQEGLQMALDWHRRVSMDRWAGLVHEIVCPFMKDEAAEYLRGIVIRSRVVNGM